jgi:hypothetical protein
MTKNASTARYIMSAPSTNPQPHAPSNTRERPHSTPNVPKKSKRAQTLPMAPSS